MATTKTEEHRFTKLPEALSKKIQYGFSESPVIPLKRMAELAQVSKSNYALFQPILNEAKAALPLLLAVVQGNVEALQRLVVANPHDFFKEGQVKDPSEKIFYGVSPFQLIVFLCDVDMLCQILPLIPIELLDKCAAQYAKIDCGGADLVSMDRDPTKLDFSEITQFNTSYTIVGAATPVTFSLLENLDGIIHHYNESTKEHQFYLVNRDKKTVDGPLEYKVDPKDAPAFEKLCESLAKMPKNSSRRSSNAEHALFARLIQHKLSRKGIQYEYQGVLYCDSRIDFNLIINAYRTCIRLYEEQRLDEGDNSWSKGVGGAQRQVLWILQRLCEPNRPFYPMPNFTESPFQRSFEIDGYLYFSKGKSVCSGGRWRSAVGWWEWPSDLVALNCLIGKAKARVIKFRPDEELTDDTTSTPGQRSGC
jgi:hypothetical protein